MIYNKRKKNNNDILINLLFKSKNMYGEPLAFTNKEIVPFIYGSRYAHSIINLKEISLFLKRVFKLIKSMIQKNEKILIIGNDDEIKFLFTTAFIKKNSNLIFFTKEWINGLVTNKIMNTTFNKVINYLLKKHEIKLILIIKSSVKDTYLNQEISTLKIPTISLINTSQAINKVTYPIITNSKNIQSIYTLMYLFRKIF